MPKFKNSSATFWVTFKQCVAAEMALYLGTTLCVPGDGAPRKR